MAVKVAQASHSEFYKTGDPRWGMPPNQLRTGVNVRKPYGNLDGELNIMDWYRMSENPWKIRFRAKNLTIREHIADLAEAIVKNGNAFGYSQYNKQYPRTGLFDALAAQPFPDPLAVKALANCDCTALVGSCVYHAGVKDIKLRTMYSGNMEAVLDGTGAFEKTREGLNSTKGLLRGDILLALNGDNGHACIVISDDSTTETVPYEILNCYQCNLRSGPSKDYKVLRVLDEKDIVGLISWASTGWGQVRKGLLIGYVAPEYLHKIDRYALVKSDAWLRKNAGKNNEGLKVIPKGTKLPITGETKRVNLTTWYRAVYDGTEGYVSGKLLKVW